MPAEPPPHEGPGPTWGRRQGLCGPGGGEPWLGEGRGSPASCPAQEARQAPGVGMGTPGCGATGDRATQGEVCASLAPGPAALLTQHPKWPQQEAQCTSRAGMAGDCWSN